MFSYYCNQAFIVQYLALFVHQICIEFRKKIKAHSSHLDGCDLYESKRLKESAKAHEKMFGKRKNTCKADDLSMVKQRKFTYTNKFASIDNNNGTATLKHSTTDKQLNDFLRSAIQLKQKNALIRSQQRQINQLNRDLKQKNTLIINQQRQLEQLNQELEVHRQLNPPTKKNRMSCKQQNANYVQQLHLNQSRQPADRAQLGSSPPSSYSKHPSRTQVNQFTKQWADELYHISGGNTDIMKAVLTEFVNRPDIRQADVMSKSSIGDSILENLRNLTDKLKVNGLRAHTVNVCENV